MSRATWLALADRAESARAEGCRELDAEIALAGGWVREASDWWWPPHIVALARIRKRSKWGMGVQPKPMPPHYTTSLDAALATVPEGCGIELRRYWLSMSLSHAYDIIKHGPQDGVAWSAVLAWGIRGDTAEAKDCATGALAILAASCRARAKMETE